MSIAALLLLLAQDVPAQPAPAEDENEIVVQATYGTTTMLFDKGADGRLRNCRIMVSSGSQRRDTNACQATPVCFEATKSEVTDCVAFTAIEPSAPAPARNPAAIFDLPRLVSPQPSTVAEIGPQVDTAESPETARQRVKLPPLPKSPTGGPVIRITNGNAEDK